MSEMHPSELKKLLEDNPPGYRRYLTYEELVESMESDENTKIESYGKSSEGRKILGFKIGKGDKNVLIYGQPHSDELVGTLTVDYLAKLLDNMTKKPEYRDFRFILIPTIDPDGLEKNKSWIKEPFSPRNYFLKCYHRPDSKDIDWSFPIKHKGYKFKTKLKETKIITKLIKKYRPVFFSSLHCIQFAGVHIYADNNYENIFNEIEKFVEESGIPLQKGIPFFAEEEWAYRPGFFKFYGTKDWLNEQCDNTDKNLYRGEFSAVYYKNYCPEGKALIPEVPLYYDQILKSTKIGTKTKKEVALLRCDIMKKILNDLYPIWFAWKRRLNKKYHQFSRMREIMEVWPKDIQKEREYYEIKGSTELATVSEEYSNEVIVQYNNCNIIGIFYQLISNSPALSSSDRNVLLNYLEDMIDDIEKKVKERSNIEISNLNTLVKIQSFAILNAINSV